MSIDVDLAALRVACRGITLSGIEPIIDGHVPAYSQPQLVGAAMIWDLDDGKAILEVEPGEAPRLNFRIEGISPTRHISSVGIRFSAVEGIRQYLRNGYQSWDGSFFVEPGTPAGEGPAAKAPTLGFAMTALLPRSANGALVVGFSRHDRFQSRFDFGGSAEQLDLKVQTLWDGVRHEGIVAAEPLMLLENDGVEDALRHWSRILATESPLAPRVPDQRITGWCSWYNLYAAVDERSILEHLDAAAKFRDENQVPLNVFQVDDGFTPEMGDWLDVKPQFPRGMKPLLEEIAAAGFTPGLWIAPFLVGNRSRLYAQHPDWMVQSASGGSLAHMKFYGEFRWHKRSEEYYILDVTHPDAAEYIRSVFQTWRDDWGVRYFKTDFMNAGMEYGPDQAKWHEGGLSRVEIWRRMASIIRDGVGENLWLGCGCPLWASVGFVDAVRIGRDIGVSWHGEYSAESLLRDQQTRNHASGILWQADPDCVLLRERFHDLSDDEAKSLLLFAGLCCGVLMTSDKLDEVPRERGQLFGELLSELQLRCDFPDLGSSEPIVVQRVVKSDGTIRFHLFNPTAERLCFDVARIGRSGAPIGLRPHSSAIVV